MKNVYRIAYDIRLGREWLSGGNPNGWNSRNVLANGDARAACALVEKHERGMDYDGKRVKAVRIVSVELVARDVLA